MKLLLNLTDLSDEPLHGQISRQIRARILAGGLADGEGLPSIRGLARDSRVSVITVQRAYEDLEREGLIHARRGKGFFVRALDLQTKTELAEQRFREALEPVVREGRADGLETDQMRTVFQVLVEDRLTEDPQTEDPLIEESSPETSDRDSDGETDR